MYAKLPSSYTLSYLAHPPANIIHLNALSLSLSLSHLYHCRKTNDVPEQYREEGEMVVPAYGYFVRGAQTTFSGVLRWVYTGFSLKPVSTGFTALMAEWLEHPDGNCPLKIYQVHLYWFLP